MAIDPSISLRVQGIEAPNPLLAYGQVAQIQNAQNQNALAQYQLGAAKRTDEQQNALNSLYAQHLNPETGQVNMKGVVGGLAAGGHGALIPQQLAAEQERQTKAATLEKTHGEIVGLQKKYIDDVARNLSADPSDSNIIKHAQGIQQGNFSAELKSWAADQEKTLLSMKPDQRKAYLEKSGATAGDFVSAANNAATVAEQKRGHTLQNERAIETNKIARERETRLAQGPIGTNLTPEQNDALFGENGAVAKGLINPSKINSRNAKMWADAFVRNPSANPVKVGQEIAASDAAVKSFLGDGKSAQKVESANTAIGHLQSLKDLYAAQQNGDTRAFNAAANAIASQFGGAAPTNLQMAVQIVGPEIAKSVIGTSSSMREREEFVSGLSGKAASPAQFAGAIDTTTGLLTTRLGEVENSYKRQTKRDDFRSTFLNPTSRAILDKASATAAPATNAPAATKSGATVSNW